MSGKIKGGRRGRREFDFRDPLFVKYCLPPPLSDDVCARFAQKTKQTLVATTVFPGGEVVQLGGSPRCYKSLKEVSC